MPTRIPQIIILHIRYCAVGCAYIQASRYHKTNKHQQVKHLYYCCIGLLLGVTGCEGQSASLPTSETDDSTTIQAAVPAPLVYDTTAKVLHIFVALCDNTYQGIVPVPAKIGNGQDPNNNLYWGCGYGIRTYFKKSAEWKLVSTQKIDSTILERVVFKHTQKNIYLIADAWNGKYIEACTDAFLSGSCGQLKDTVHVGQTIIGAAGNAQMLAYIGHDGLMDFQLPDTYRNTDSITRDIIILACYSKSYFSPLLQDAGVRPLVWTTGLMAPEAYTVHDAISGYVKNESVESIRSKAALAYSQYQKCSEKAGRNLLVSGF